MTIANFISERFCRVDDGMRDESKLPQVSLWPRKSVTVGLLFKLKGEGESAPYPCLERDYRRNVDLPCSWLQAAPRSGASGCHVVVEGPARPPHLAALMAEPWRIMAARLLWHFCLSRKECE
jgi:hypothetical protein